MLFPLDHLEGAKGQVPRELKGESFSPQSLVTAVLALHKFSEGVDDEEGCGKPFGVRGEEWRGARVIIIINVLLCDSD